MKLRGVLRGVVLGSVLAAAGASCSLGLDESLIGAADGSAPPNPTGTTPTGDGAPFDARPPNPSDGSGDGATTCRVDSECKGSGCVVGKCDVPNGRCVYEICPQADPCRAARCDTATNTCQPPMALPLHEEFPLAETVNQSGQFRAIAMVPPYAFVNTLSGVVAYLYREPGLPKTIKPVAGAPFTPTFLFSTGRRLFMVGGPIGSAQRKVPVAWLDVPQDPSVELRAQAGFAPYAGTSLAFALPFQGDKAVFAHQSPSPSFALGEPPFLGPISPSPTPTAQSYAQFIASGDRLVAVRNFFTTAAPAMSFVTGVGTASPTFGAEQAISPGGQFIFQGGAQLATNSKGMTAMAWPLYNTQLPYQNAVSQVRLAWVLDDDKDQSFTASDPVDPTTFAPPGSPFYGNLAGPMAFADERTLFATFAAASSPTARLAAGFFVRGGGADAGAGLNVLTDFPMSPQQVYGAAAAPGVGAVVGNNGTVLHYVRQGCAP